MARPKLIPVLFDTTFSFNNYLLISYSLPNTVSTQKSKTGTAFASMEHTVVTEALALTHILQHLYASQFVSSISHALAFIYISYLPLLHLISLINFEPNV